MYVCILPRIQNHSKEKRKKEKAVCVLGGPGFEFRPGYRHSVPSFVAVFSVHVGTCLDITLN
jgi:hypothetical protein